MHLNKNFRGEHFVRLICCFMSGMKLILSFSGSQCEKKCRFFPSFYILKPTFDTRAQKNIIALHFCASSVKAVMGVSWVCALWWVRPSSRDTRSPWEVDFSSSCPVQSRVSRFISLEHSTSPCCTWYFNLLMRFSRDLF